MNLHFNIVVMSNNNSVFVFGYTEIITKLFLTHKSTKQIKKETIGSF